jgi:hypothetical protein
VREVCTCRNKFFNGTERNLLFVITFVKNILVVIELIVFFLAFGYKSLLPYIYIGIG